MTEEQAKILANYLDERRAAIRAHGSVRTEAAQAWADAGFPGANHPKNGYYLTKVKAEESGEDQDVIRASWYVDGALIATKLLELVMCGEELGVISLVDEEERVGKLVGVVIKSYYAPGCCGWDFYPHGVVDHQPTFYMRPEDWLESPFILDHLEF